MDRFLIPANSKKSMLIFGLFNGTDAIIFGVGIGTTLLLLAIMQPSATLDTFLALLPGIITVFLLYPVPNYHNIRTAIKSIWNFFWDRQVFVWKGWCIDRNGDEPNKK